jgi:hypothetical protein
VKSFFLQLFDILEVTSHPVFEVLMHISTVDIICHLTSDFVDDYRYSTDTAILVLASSAASADAFPL